jgi:hypothetical protein
MNDEAVPVSGCVHGGRRRDVAHQGKERAVHRPLSQLVAQAGSGEASLLAVRHVAARPAG